MKQSSSSHISEPYLYNFTQFKSDACSAKATPGAKTINVFRACLGAQLTICAHKWRNFVLFSTVSLRFVLSRVSVFLYSPGPGTKNVFWACIGAQLTICAQKWRNFVCSSTLSLRFVLSRVCVFLYSLGPRARDYKRFWACIGAQLTICAQKWRNFVWSSKHVVFEICSESNFSL